MAPGEIGLAVARVGWTPVRGGLTEVRTDEHGTHPLAATPPGMSPADLSSKDTHR